MEIISQWGGTSRKKSYIKTFFYIFSWGIKRRMIIAVPAWKLLKLKLAKNSANESVFSQ
jgi:hypothetical protein